MTSSSAPLADYLALCKPRIAVMVMATAAMGFFVGGGEAGSVLGWLLIGTGLSSSACGCLNQVLESRQDGLMARTRARPLPSGRMPALWAACFGVALGGLGLSLLAGGCGRLAAFITAATIVGYVAVYTPLKRLTPQTTWVGAAAGATAPLIGWAAARGTLAPQAWVLFAIQFLWQIPHFLAMFWLHRADYERAGFKTMPVVDPRGGKTAAQIALHSFSVLPAAMLPVFFGMAGKGYGFAALALSTGYLLIGLKASWSLGTVDTRRLFLASLAYLPLLFAFLLIGGV